MEDALQTRSVANVPLDDNSISQSHGLPAECDLVRSASTAEHLLRTASTAAALRWQSGRRELSIGLELECFLPDVGALVPDRLVPVLTQQQLYEVVAGIIDQELRKVGACDAHRCRRTERVVSAESDDWGRLWTATSDGSIRPQGANPFAVELVSKRMGYEDIDVTLFCDMVHTLRSPPLSAETNDSTGFHVHVGKYPDFFSFEEIVAILKAYLVLETAINRLLPVSRRWNKYCKDFRELLAWAAGIEDCHSNEVLLKHIDNVAIGVKSFPPQDKAALLDQGLRGTMALADLESGLLGEGTLWRSKKLLHLCLSTNGIADRYTWVPPGAVLCSLAAPGPSLEARVCWQRPSAEEISQAWDEGKELLSPLDVLDELGNTHTDIVCVFKSPDGLTAETFDLWLLRDGLILDRHVSRYCKLNLKRICLPSAEATLEFRQFPGGNFDNILTIWAWVKFLGVFVMQACALSHGAPNVCLPTEGSEEELKRFLQMRNDTLLLAWYRDMTNRHPAPELALSCVQADWDRLWAEWLCLAQPADPSTFEQACEVWVRVCRACAQMEGLADTNGGVLCHQTHAHTFMLQIYKSLHKCLQSYLRRLRAAEEISRVASLPTIIEYVLEDGTLRNMQEEIRRLKLVVVETLGWDTCPHEMRHEIIDWGSQATQLMLDHTRNLLTHCENATSWQTRLDQRNTHASETSAPLDSPASRQLAEEPLVRSDTMISYRVAHLPETTPSSCTCPLAEQCARVQRVYIELCRWLLVPRVDECEGVWAGLRHRGWDSERVTALNAAVRDLIARNSGPVPNPTDAGNMQSRGNGALEVD